MASIVETREHDLDAASARAAVDDMAARLGRRYGFESRWEGSVLHLSGRGATGQVQLAPGAARVSVSLPLALRPLKSAVRSEIRSQLDRAFSPTPA